MASIDKSDPAGFLRLMVEGLIPYDSRRAHDAAIRVAGGSVRSLPRSDVLVKFAFQLEAMAEAAATDQPGLARIFRRNAKAALSDLAAACAA